MRVPTRIALWTARSCCCWDGWRVSLGACLVGYSRAGVTLESLGGGVFAPALLRQIGGLCLLDACCANSDRLPAGKLFQNDGNSTNLQARRRLWMAV